MYFEWAPPAPKVCIGMYPRAVPSLGENMELQTLDIHDTTITPSDTSNQLPSTSKEDKTSSSE